MKKTILTTILAILLAIPLTLQAKGIKVEGVVNVNTASLKQLTLVPGIGPKKAEAIIALRKATPFKKGSDLTQVKGIGPKMMEKIAPYIVLSGETTLRKASKQGSQSPSAKKPARG